MDFLSTDIMNPFYAGFAFECDFDRKLQNIVDRCGIVIESSKLTEELEKEGIDLRSLSPHEIDLIDNLFDCF